MAVDIWEGFFSISRMDRNIQTGKFDIVYYIYSGSTLVARCTSDMYADRFWKKHLASGRTYTEIREDVWGDPGKLVHRMEAIPYGGNI